MSSCKEVVVIGYSGCLQSNHSPKMIFQRMFKIVLNKLRRSCQLEKPNTPSKCNHMNNRNEERSYHGLKHAVDREKSVTFPYVSQGRP